MIVRVPTAPWSRPILSPSCAASIAACALTGRTTLVTPWARVVPRIRLRKKVRMEDFMIKNLFHGGSGGFDGHSAPGWDCNRHLQGKYNRLGGGSPIEQVTMSTKHTYVITGAIVVLILGIRWSGINTGRVGGEGKIPIGKIGELSDRHQSRRRTGNPRLLFLTSTLLSLYLSKLCSITALAGALNKRD